MTFTERNNGRDSVPTNRFTEISVECLQEVEIMTAWWVAQLCAGRCDSFPVILSLISRTKCVSIPRNRMGEFRKYGSVGGAPGNRCFYPAVVIRISSPEADES